jgi:hypothetical protein
MIAATPWLRSSLPADSGRSGITILPEAHPAWSNGSRWHKIYPFAFQIDSIIRHFVQPNYEPSRVVHQLVGQISFKDQVLYHLLTVLLFATRLRLRLKLEVSSIFSCRFKTSFTGFWATQTELAFRQVLLLFFPKGVTRSSSSFRSCCLILSNCGAVLCAKSKWK